MQIRKTNRKPKGTRVGRQIIRDLRAAVKVLESGQSLASRFTVRTVEMPDAPRPYDATAVRATRALLGASQPVFARLLGVSPGLVRSLEQGQRTAAPVVRRLLDEINRDPQRWQAMLRGSTVA